jgi:hypothetical protein
MQRWIVILIWLCGPLTIGQLTGVRDASGQLAAIFGYNHQGVLSVISNAVGRVASALYDKEDRPGGSPTVRQHHGNGGHSG